MKLTDADVQEIIRLLDASDYDELELETERFRLVLRREGTGAAGWSQRRETHGQPHIEDAPEFAGPPAEASGGEARPDAAEADDGAVYIRSPMIGTFYRAPRPGADPFVRPGSQVEPDSVIAIIEVMKLMNSVAAGVTGEVLDVLAEDGHLVEKGQRLMRVRPAPPGDAAAAE